MKATTPDMHDAEPRAWSLSWNPDGRSEKFTREAILVAAPAVSGVYGLFNFNCQIFIGAAANIREALLRHESETDFQSAHLRPTGFTFEPYAEELRAGKAAELIAKFHPVLQAEATLTEISTQVESSSVSNPPIELVDTVAEPREFQLDDREEHPRVRPQFNWKRTITAALFAAGAIVVVYLGLFTNSNIQERANGASEVPMARAPVERLPTSQQVSSGSQPQHVSSTAVSVRAETESKASLPIRDTTKKWSVQISAVPAKTAADALMQRLKESGYDSYVVTAEVKGQSYYRVRVGRFDSQADAESVRQLLADKEGFPDAYLAGD